jgi:hypothetical protein
MVYILLHGNKMYCLFINSWIFQYFQFLAIMNNINPNIHIQGFLCTFSFFFLSFLFLCWDRTQGLAHARHHPSPLCAHFHFTRSRVTESYSDFIFQYLRKYQNVFQSRCNCTSFPTIIHDGYRFLSLPACEIVSSCGFDLYFSGG